MDIAKYAAKKNKTNTKTKLKKELLKHFNMTPKEKAKELFEKMLLNQEKSYEGANIGYNEVKQCALIAVDEILGFLSYQSHIRYWQEVKKEIEIL